MLHLFALLLIFSVSWMAYAKDSTELSLERQKIYSQTSFYCEVGRAPLRSSADAWALAPTRACTFNGPLDTKVNRLRLEPPFLNPRLTLSQLADFLTQNGLPVEQRNGTSFHFHLATGEGITASLVDKKNMIDPLLHFSGYPIDWGNQFVSLSANDPKALEQFIGLTNHPLSPLFWNNPHFAEEVQALPRLQGARAYRPLPLLSKCGSGEWRNFGGAQSLLLVGDMHRAEDTLFFESLLQAKSFAWVALEISRDRDQALQQFLSATDPSEEEKLLKIITNRKSNENILPSQAVLKTLKSQKKPVILLDYQESYFNFPYTNTSFHGLIMGARNLMWAGRLPASWQGTGILLGGLDHFTATPHADFQDFAWERFPGLEMGLVNPLEVCP